MKKITILTLVIVASIASGAATKQQLSYDPNCWTNCYDEARECFRQCPGNYPCYLACQASLDACVAQCNANYWNGE